MERNAVTFGAEKCSSVHVGDKNKYALVLDEGPTQGLDNTTLTAKSKYPINFTQPNKRFVLSLHHNGGSKFLFVNVTKIYQLKAKNSETCAEFS